MVFLILFCILAYLGKCEQNETCPCVNPWDFANLNTSDPNVVISSTGTLYFKDDPPPSASSAFRGLHCNAAGILHSSGLWIVLSKLVAFPSLWVCCTMTYILSQGRQYHGGVRWKPRLRRYPRCTFLVQLNVVVSWRVTLCLLGNSIATAIGATSKKQTAIGNLQPHITSWLM